MSLNHQNPTNSFKQEIKVRTTTYAHFATNTESFVFLLKSWILTFIWKTFLSMRGCQLLASVGKSEKKSIRVSSHQMAKKIVAILVFLSDLLLPQHSFVTVVVRGRDVIYWRPLILPAFDMVLVFTVLTIHILLKKTNKLPFYVVICTCHSRFSRSKFIKT